MYSLFLFYTFGFFWSFATRALLSEIFGKFTQDNSNQQLTRLKGASSATGNGDRQGKTVCTNISFIYHHCRYSNCSVMLPDSWKNIKINDGSGKYAIYFTGMDLTWNFKSLLTNKNDFG